VITAHPLIQGPLIAPQLLLWIALPHHGAIMLATNYLFCRCYSVPFGEHAVVCGPLMGFTERLPQRSGVLPARSPRSPARARSSCAWLPAAVAGRGAHPRRGTRPSRTWWRGRTGYGDLSSKMRTSSCLVL